MFMAYDLSRVSVLIAEHHDYMRKTMHGIMKCFNVGEISMVGTVDDAKEALSHRPYDVLFSDWSPSFDGLGLMDWLRRAKESSNQYMPAIMVSAYAERRHVLQARDHGINEYIVKPVSAQLVHSRMVAVIEHDRCFVRTNQFFGPDRRRKSGDFNGDDRRGRAA